MTPEAKKAIDAFRINTCGPLGTGMDAVHEILPMIHAFSTLLESGFRKEQDGTSCLDAMNPELVASAFDGIAYLAALAMFHVDEA